MYQVIICLGHKKRRTYEKLQALYWTARGAGCGRQSQQAKLLHDTPVCVRRIIFASHYFPRLTYHLQEIAVKSRIIEWKTPENIWNSLKPNQDRNTEKDTGGWHLLSDWRQDEASVVVVLTKCAAVWRPVP